MLHLLQVCNVGRIVGGTAACAWTVTRSLPDARHTVLFLSDITANTREAFSHCRLLRRRCVSSEDVVRIRPDVVLLHNMSHDRCDPRLPMPTVQWLHSRIRPATADVTVACSRWLADRVRLSEDDVLYQAVSRPPAGQAFQPDTNVFCPVDALRPPRQAGKPDLRIGRICTPISKKWPRDLLPLYARLASQFPNVTWEFIGCPSEMQSRLLESCRGRAMFQPASWSARSRFWNWDAMLYHNPHVTESFGRTVAEAMRAGCVPIVDNRGGFREQVAAGCGFLCETLDDFAAAVSQLHSPSTQIEMSRRCRGHADERFSLATFRERLLAVFHRTLSNYSGITARHASVNSVITS